MTGVDGTAAAHTVRRRIVTVISPTPKPPFPDGSTPDPGGAVVRLSRGGRYCSGFLSSPGAVAAAIDGDRGVTSGPTSTDFVLTAAHFLRAGDDPSGILVSGAGIRATVRDARVIVGTDIAVVRLVDVVPTAALPALAPEVPPLFSTTVTHGFGGTRPGEPAQARRGLLLAKVPFAVSLNLRTRVRHAAVCVPTERNQVVYGDSGGPVFVAGGVIGVQSLLVGYRHRELVNIATVAVLAPHLTAVRRAMGIMSGR